MKPQDQNKTVNNTRNNSPASQSGKKPETRDNLDSRKNEEQDDKGKDTTHNKKETKGDK
jgi:hypothetical protein